MSTTKLPDEGPRVRITANVDDYVEAMRSIDETHYFGDGHDHGEEPS